MGNGLGKFVIRQRRDRILLSFQAYGTVSFGCPFMVVGLVAEWGLQEGRVQWVSLYERVWGNGFGGLIGR